MAYPFFCPALQDGREEGHRVRAEWEHGFPNWITHQLAYAAALSSTRPPAGTADREEASHPVDAGGVRQREGAPAQLVGRHDAATKVRGERIDCRQSISAMRRGHGKQLV